MIMTRKRALGALTALGLGLTLIVPAVAGAVTTLKISGSTTVYPIAQVLASQYKARTGVVVTVAGGGSSVGINDVLAGRVDIGMSSRDLKQSEIDNGAVGTVFAKDAVAIIVNPGNPVSNLTEAQVRAIYRGQITNWRQVGGPNARIILCGRTAASGTYEFFKEKFLLGARQSSLTRAYSSNGMVRSAVAQNRYAIGYVSLAYINRTVKGVKIGGVAPTRYNASTGRYRYVRPLYWVTKGAPAGAAKKFIDWTRSSTGQSYVVREFLSYR